MTGRTIAGQLTDRDRTLHAGRSVRADRTVHRGSAQTRDPPQAASREKYEQAKRSLDERLATEQAGRRTLEAEAAQPRQTADGARAEAETARAAATAKEPAIGQP